MKLRLFALVVLVLAATACKRVDDAEPPPVAPRTDAAVGGPSTGVSPSATPGSAPASADPQVPRLVAEALVIEQWEEAENRSRCAPLAFAATGGARGAPRPAQFAGGWAVAFDLPNLRSAYGLAGPGLVADDGMDPVAQRTRLLEQWPYVRDLMNLPQPAFAGYGIEGSAPYPADNSSGRGVNSLAYVRVAGQTCTYNVWSRLGRAHLETLLDELRLVPVD